jgi:hypothetical protein
MHITGMRSLGRRRNAVCRLTDVIKRAGPILDRNG